MIDDMESITAKLCSFARAYHSRYAEKKIFDDYLAYDLMGREGYEEIGQLIENGYEMKCSDPCCSFSCQRIRAMLERCILPIPISRAAFTERELIRFSFERGPCQYVICGAGMDTFGFRNRNSDVQVFEIDHPNTQRYKLEKIRKLGWTIPENIHYVPVDFSKDDMAEELIKAGYDPEVPSFFSMLGVTYYLTLPVFERTMEHISAITSYGSMMVFDFPDETTFSEDAPERVHTLSSITAMLGEEMVHGYSPLSVQEALTRHGFLVDEHESPEKIQERFFDGRNDDLRAYENIHFVLAKKADRFNESYRMYI